MAVGHDAAVRVVERPFGGYDNDYADGNPPECLCCGVCALPFREVNHTYSVAAARRSVSRVSSAFVSTVSCVHTVSNQLELSWIESFALEYLIARIALLPAHLHGGSSTCFSGSGSLHVRVGLM